jgi:hypothetical protein
MSNSPCPPPLGHKPILSNRSSPPPSGSFEFCEICGWRGCKWA